MKSYALYRLPYAERYTAIVSEREAETLSSVSEVGERQGFLVAPFSACHDHPILLIQPDSITEHTVNDGRVEAAEENIHNSQGQVAAEESLQGNVFPSERATASYRDAFHCFHDAVSDGRFRKLVLSRSKTIATAEGEKPERLFLRACAAFPRLMIMLFHTRQSGTWLIASPEILLEKTGDMWHTVALAGTMPYSEGLPEWSSKNKAEQHVVEEYISQTITPFARQTIKDGPFTIRAGNVQHLRTDFRFTPQHSAEDITGEILSRLHPTPAVCGMPKSEARDFILTHEPHDREYYSGFAGPLNIGCGTHLYVSLRCARLCGGSMTLFAGGGIMPESICEAEWQETEQKMKTISCIATKKM